MSAQFRTLYRLSLSRLIDMEILSSRGDLQGLAARVGGVLIAISFILLPGLVIPYWFTQLNPRQLAPRLWNDEEFLISLTLAASGLLSVLAWNSVLPDRRDCLVLGTLPIRVRTIALARLAAILSCIAGLVLLVNAFTGLTFPYAMTTGITEGARAFGAWWLTLLLAALFAFTWMVALQGVAAMALPWNLFLRISGILQLAALATVVGLFFLTPPFAITVKKPDSLLWLLSSYWFTGLYHLMRADTTPLLRQLAGLAARNLAVVALLSAVSLSLVWLRNMRRIVEAPDIAGNAGRGVGAWCVNRLLKIFVRRPLDRAILLFTARTTARSRQHRLLLAAYAGIGFALAATFSRSLLNGVDERWDRPNVPFLVMGSLAMVCAVLGTRAIFAIPLALAANWSFRITSVHSPARYFAAVRKALLLWGALPAWLVCGVAYLTVWPGRYAVQSMIVLALLGLLLTDYSLYQFRKLPFTCSFLPASGQSFQTVRALALGAAFLMAASALAGIELWAIKSASRFVVLVAPLSLWEWRRYREWRDFASWPTNTVQFDDVPPAEIFALDLRPDGEWSSEQAWVDSIDIPARPLAEKLKRIALATTILLAAGYLFEHISEWRDRRSYPQLGKSIDIGGRTLNIHCQGQGSPAVILDSGGNQPGYSWKLVKPGISNFTRACWYDRAGYGWSDPAPGPRTSADIADDLHNLLRAARISPPYVLVGHSFGGFNVRVFASRYPGEAVGMVLVDSASETEAEFGDLPRSIQGLGTSIRPAFRRPLALLAKFMVREGFARLLDDGPGPPAGGLSAYDEALLHAEGLQAKQFAAGADEGLDREESVRQVRAITGFGNLPLIVLTAGKHFAPSEDPEEVRRLEAYYQFRIYQDQPRLLRLSTQSTQHVITASGHAIPFFAPQSVVEAVRDIVEARRPR